MDDEGKNCEVLVEPDVSYDQRTGVKLPVRSLIVWADAGLKDAIAEIPGVRRVYWSSDDKTRYYVHIDPRYDVERVSQMIVEALR